MMAYPPSEGTLERFLYVQFETEVCHAAAGKVLSELLPGLTFLWAVLRPRTLDIGGCLLNSGSTAGVRRFLS